MNETRIFSSALATATDDELVQAAAALPTELALGLLAITRALRPRTGRERQAYQGRLRRALAKARPHQTMLRMILKEAMRQRSFHADSLWGAVASAPTAGQLVARR